MAPDGEPYREGKELREQERLEEAEGSVATGADGQDDQGGEGGDEADQQGALAVAGGGQRDGSAVGKLGGDTGVEVYGDVDSGRGFEGASDALIQNLVCGNLVWRLVWGLRPIAGI